MRPVARLLLTAALAVAGAAPAWALELVMVERVGCVWCARWNRDVAPIYPKTEEGRRAPLRRIDIGALPSGMVLDRPVVFTPTFLVVDGSREVGRITGYADDAMFWGLLGDLLRRNTVSATDPAAGVTP